MTVFAISDAARAIMSPLMTAQSARDSVQTQACFDATCDRALDYYYCGAAQEVWLRRELHRRLGEGHDPRDVGDDDTCVLCGTRGAHETDDGRIIREGRLELVTQPVVESVLEDLAVLYAADDLRRVYQLPSGATADGVEGIIEGYHDAANGHLAPRLQQLDELVLLLRTCFLLTRWNVAKGSIAYDLLMPHWVRYEPHPEWPLDLDLSYSVAYPEATEENDSGRRVAVNRWVAYQRPPVAGFDADGSRLWESPRGRFVRYEGDTAYPLPDPVNDHIRIIEDGDNPMAAIGGMASGRLLWQPLVVCNARPPIESIVLPVQDDLVRLALEVDVAFSLLAYVANSQSHGQPVMRGSGDSPKTLGASTLVRIDDPAGSFSFESPNANLQGHIDVIRAMLQTSAMLRKLAPDSWSMQRPSIQTGPAKLYEQAGLVEKRWRRANMADAWEAGRFARERLLHNAYGTGKKIPWDAKQVVHWGELRIPVDRNMQVQRLIQEISLGTISRVDAVMETWGISRSDAEAKITEIDGDGVSAQIAEPQGAEQQSAEPQGTEPQGTEPQGAEPEGEGVAQQQADTDAVLAKLRIVEGLVKARSPQPVIRAVVRSVADMLGISSAEVIASINEGEFVWYTSPPEMDPSEDGGSLMGNPSTKSQSAPGRPRGGQSAGSDSDEGEEK